MSEEVIVLTRPDGSRVRLVRSALVGWAKSADKRTQIWVSSSEPHFVTETPEKVDQLYAESR